MTTTVRRAARVDIDAVVDTLQQAFYDDPVMCWMLPDDRSRRWRSAKLFETLIRGHYLALDAVWTTDEHAGGALWSPPGHWQLPPATIARNTVPMVRALGRRTPAALRFLTAVERHHPAEPHWYLAVLGTAPRHQRRGVGSALLEPVLARCDEEGLPAYLESSKESNLPFYGRHGFEVTEELRPVAGGPTLWGMWRKPR